MPTPFDATTKSLLERDPLAWVHLFGLVGEDAEAQHLLRLLGDKRFGKPTDTQAAKIANESRTEQLEAWATRLLEATSWNELLA